MMRIAYVINSVEGGGAASPVPAVTQVMRDQGAAVKVFALTRRDGRGLPAMQAAGLEPVVRAGGLHDHVAALRWLAAETRRWGATHLWTSLTRATLLGLVLGPWRGIPVVCWQHAAYLKPGNRRLLRLMQSRAKLWVADSACVAALTAERLQVEPGRLMTWPIFAANAAAPVAAGWSPGESLQIGSLGRLHPVKGYDLLIDALADLKRNGFVPPAPLAVTIAGDGDERPRLEAMIRDAGLTGIALPGFTDRAGAFLAAQHLYVQPSRSEGFGIAAHEAMVAGLPVVASAVGEMPHSIEDGTSGYLFARGDSAALAATLQRALAQPERLAIVGAAARARILERFSRQRFIDTGSSIVRRVAAVSA
jgi:glycosyltransferase involved in cell wall biosynthesis